MKGLLAGFFKDESGATAVEYGLLASLIAIAIIGGATAIGTNITAVFQSLTTTLS